MKKLFMIIIVIVGLGIVFEAVSSGESKEYPAVEETTNTSTTPDIPPEYKAAYDRAESYCTTSNLSKTGLYNQLTSFIEAFPPEAASYAVENISCDWNNNALEQAKSYRNTLSMSNQAIYDQLISDFEGFTPAEAQYALDNLDK